MGDIAKLVCGWSWEENKEFELALAMVDEDEPKRWEVVAAAMVGGGKRSAEEVQKQYVLLLEDLEFIESGFMDAQLEIDDHHHHPCLQLDSVVKSPPYWTDEDQHLLVRLEINRLQV